MKFEVRDKIRAIISGALLKKIESHLSESEYKPFFSAIFNKNQIMVAALIQSFYTSFGMSIYEQIGKILAEGNGFEAYRQYHLLGIIDRDTTALITEITNELKAGKRIANSSTEIKELARSIKPGAAKEVPNNIVDLFIKDKEGNEYYFGITTVKSNKEGFENHKNKLLRWMALRLSQNKKARVNVATVIPYNPYYPEPYKRFGSSSLFDKRQFLVQEEFWDFIGGKGTFNELIDICESVWNELRGKIDAL